MIAIVSDHIIGVDHSQLGYNVTGLCLTSEFRVFMADTADPSMETCRIVGLFISLMTGCRF